MKNVYIDESQRGNRYYICVVSVPESEMQTIRAFLRTSCPSGVSRIHMHATSQNLQRHLLRTIKDFNLDITLVATRKVRGDSHLAPRERCLCAAFAIAQSVSVRNIFLENSNSIHWDKQLISRFINDTRQPMPYISHANPAFEPLLWLPDIVAWGYGRGGDWRTLTAPLLTGLVRV